MTTLSLPRAARFACWLAALVDGRVSVDDAIDGVRGEDAAHDVLDGTGTAEPLALALPRLRAAGPTAIHVAMPAPGDLRGLAGPAELNVEALEAGECVVLPAAGTGLIPQSAGRGVVWRRLPADDPPRHDLAEASRGLRRSISETATALAELDVAAWSPEATDLLLELRAPAALDLPPGLPGDAVGVLTTALRCRAIVTAAQAGDGAALTAAETQRRRSVLGALDGASRLAVSAAASTYPRR